MALISSAHEVGPGRSPSPTARRGAAASRPLPPWPNCPRAGLPLGQPARISELSGRDLDRHDALVVAAYGQILRPDTLYAARHGAYNVHASSCPKYRGAAPIERAIMNGETETGVTIMRMDEGLDTGPSPSNVPSRYHPDANGGDLTGLLANAGAEAIVEGLDLLEDDSANPLGAG